MKMISNIVASAKVIIAFFIHLHIVRNRKIKKCKILLKDKKCLSC